MINRNYTKLALAIGAVILAGAGAAYASFISNSVNLSGSRVTTGSASLKLCQPDNSNIWRTSINSTLDLASIIPDEERDAFGNSEFYLGNDNGQLSSAVGNGLCVVYGEAASHSNTPMRILPTVSFSDTDCPDPLQSNVKLRFEIAGKDTGYKTLNSWQTNTTSYEPTLQPGQVGRVKVFAQLSSTAVAQEKQCDFSLTFSGKQPSA